MKAILFDLDRTLHDRDASVIQFLQAQHQRLNSLHHTAIPTTYIDRFIELECNGYVWKDQVYASLANEFNLPLSPEELLEDYLVGFHQHCRVMEGASDILSSLRSAGYKLGMITNGKTGVQNNTINSLGIRKYFDCIIISEEAGIKKPDPDIFTLAAEALNVTPSECLYVGDHYENDVKAARVSGMKAAWLTGIDSIPDELDADLVVSSLFELQGFLSS
ncbi:HAD family hydrolase [Bacillus sp. SCS-153A]|uniref:HAD family hydrolase n=1 Tax=Rossellomorea sedimentorum TaxID=3115294 RepID=UPI003905BB22